MYLLRFIPVALFLSEGPKMGKEGDGFLLLQSSVAY
jgi:hypothetical protein